MSDFMVISRVLFCYFLSVLSCSVRADTWRPNDNKIDENSERPVTKSEKLAGRANYSGANEPANVNYPLPTAQERQKRQLSKDEKEALRRQINEAGDKYSEKK